MWQLVTSLDAWAALASLAALEIVLGVDNTVIRLLASWRRLPMIAGFYAG